MEQNLNSEKTPARASQGATAPKSGSIAGNDEKKMDEVAMKTAKRGENRFREDETIVPGSTEFTK